MSDNLAIWKAVERTDPAHTKKVNQRGGFTAISAHYQVMRATEQFGPVGIGWGYHNGEPIFHDALVFVPVTIWHGNRENTFGPLYGGAEWKIGNRLDSDAIKKAATDGLTKALSHIGFNADVFLGMFDDNKYVQQVAREYAEQAGKGQSQRGAVSPSPTSPHTGEPVNDGPVKRGLDGPSTSKAQLRQAFGMVQREVISCGDDEMLTAYLATPEAKAVIEQCERDEPCYLHGGDPAPPEFEPLYARIQRMRDEWQMEKAA